MFLEKQAFRPDLHEQQALLGITPDSESWELLRYCTIYNRDRRIRLALPLMTRMAAKIKLRRSPAMTAPRLRGSA